MAKKLMQTLRDKQASAPQDVEVERVTKLTVRAELRIRNDTLITKRRELGLTQFAFGKLIEVPGYQIQAMERFDFSKPSTLEYAKKVAGFLDISLESVLPKELIGKTLPSTLVVKGSFEAERLLAMQNRFTDRFILPAPDESESALEDEDRHQMMEHAMLVLTPRERRVLGMRFNLPGTGDSDRAHSLDEVGHDLGLSRERIRQLEKRAIRKLRHPRVIRYLMKQMGEDPKDPMHICDRNGRMTVFASKTEGEEA